MAHQLTTVLEQQAALVAEHARVAELERELDRQQHWQATGGRDELAVAAGGYVTGEWPWELRLTVRLSDSSFVCLSDCLSVCLPVCLSAFLSGWVPVCLLSECLTACA